MATGRHQGDRILLLGGSGGGISDAPSDGSKYGRQNAAWVVVNDGYVDGEVQYYADLPVVIGTPAVNSSYIVREWSLLNPTKFPGIWVRLANAGTLADWTYAGDYPFFFSDAYFAVYDDADASKVVKFQLSGLTTATTRTFTFPDASGTLLYSGGPGGTPSSITLTNGTGTAAGLTAGSVTTNANLTGDVTSVGNATTHVNTPNGATKAGSELVTAIVAPGTPAAGKGSVYVDSTSKNLAVKDDAGVVKHGIQTRTATANQWIRSITDDGSTTISQPAFTDLSGSLAATQLPAHTGDVTSSAGSAALTLVAGSAANLNSGTLAVARGGTGIGSGTSGGVLAYTAAGTIASSGALAANALVIGGGAGVAPSTTTTGANVLTALGIAVGSAGAVVTNGGALGTPSSGVGSAITNVPVAAWRPYTTGLYYQTNQTDSGDATIAMTKDTAIYHAFPVGKAITIDRITVGVQAAGTATSVVRLGIYNDNGTGKPGALLLDAGTVAGDSTGYKEITVSQALLGGALYWIAVVYQVAAGGTLRASGAGAGSSWIGHTATSTDPRISTYSQLSVTGALPDPATAVAGADTFNPSVKVRIASSP